MAALEVPTLPLSTMIHMVNIKLTSSNYLLWHAQIEPLLTSQAFMPMLDGSSPAPARTANNSTAPNPDFVAWQQRDQTIKLFLVSTLTEESMALVIGCKTAKEVWDALSRSYSHNSKARELSLKDELLSTKRGDKSVVEYARHFKALSDQLTAIGRPIDASDQSHWFLRGLGSDFAGFTAAQMAQDPLPDFPTLFARAQSHELFQKSIDQTNS